MVTWIEDVSKAIIIRSGDCIAARVAVFVQDGGRLARCIETSRTALVIALASLVGLTVVYYTAYLRISLGALGFPLDDSWIYQNFARNLVRYGSLVYNPGEPAAGATSVLWVPLLALSYKLGIDAVYWSYLGGAAALLALALASYALSLVLFPGRRGVAVVASIAVATDWRMGWSALSGMETPIFTLLSIVLLWAVARGINPFLVGAAAGLLVAARPEGMLLASIVVILHLASPDGAARTSRIVHVGWLIAGLVVVLVPYFAFNWWLTGRWLPNTFFAKQAMYSGVTAPFDRLTYLIDAVRIILLGPAANALFAFGTLLATYKVLASRNVLNCAPIVWGALLLATYALRMPITMQHGRYIMPLIPVAIIFSVAGTADLLALAQRRSFKVLPRVFPLIAGAAVLASWALGARILASDVEIINSQQVETARWIERNTPPDSIVATHDIGALAYFSNRRIVDTAGLIDTDFIPVLHDPNTALAMAREKGAHYIAFLPDLYPRLSLAKGDEKVYEAGGDALSKLGFRNMVVYRLERMR